MKRIHMWSPPRACSTALMYSFGNRADCSVTDEPLYAYFLTRWPNLFRDEREAVMKTQSSEWGTVVDSVLMSNYDTDIVLHKHMAKHLFWDQDVSFLDHADNVHVLLIRDPVKQLASWHRTKYERTIDETGLVHQYQLMTYLETKGKKVVVVDSGDILEKPQEVLTELCRECGIPFDDAMLQWPAGPRPEDGAWAYYYYKSVHESTHFASTVTTQKPFPEEMKTLLEQCLPLYNAMRSRAIGPARKPANTRESKAYDLVWINNQLQLYDSLSVSVANPLVKDASPARGRVQVIAARCYQLNNVISRLVLDAESKRYTGIPSIDIIRDAVFRTLAANNARDKVEVAIVLAGPSAELLVTINPLAVEGADESELSSIDDAVALPDW